MAAYNAAVLLKKRGVEPDPVPTAICQATGIIVREQWDNIGGNDVATIPLQTAPSSTSQLTQFEAPSNIGDNYGARIRGYICPPQTGNYTFWIASDDASELWLSTDDNPTGKAKIAYVPSYTGFRQWDKYASQKSGFVYLQAGRKYYIEALHKEGNGADNLSVAWQLPNGTFEAPVSGSRLSSFITTPLLGQTISFSAISPVTLGVSPITLSATASSGLPITYSVLSGPGTINNNVLTAVGVGTVVIQAAQAGNGTYNAAAPVTQSLIVLAVPVVTSCSGTGSIVREQWDGVYGGAVSNIPLQAVPSSTSQLTQFEAASNIGDNYGARIRGYI
ncbi:MAG: hypothetical protein EOO61_23365, partial [Hymenobacter sp.]